MDVKAQTRLLHAQVKKGHRFPAKCPELEKGMEHTLTSQLSEGMGVAHAWILDF